MHVLAVIALLFALVFSFYLVHRCLEWFEDRASHRAARRITSRP